MGDQIVTGVRDLTGYTVCPGSRIKTLKHGVTRYQITLDCYEAIITSSRRENRQSKPHTVGCEQVSLVACLSVRQEEK